MKITIEIPSDRIANLMISAIESGDPVTTASRGGWCAGIDLLSCLQDLPETEEPWYASEELWAADYRLKVTEVDDESTGHTTDHLVGPADVERGLGVMAKDFPLAFCMILQDDTDAPCADILLQCILFGEEKYA